MHGRFRFAVALVLGAVLCLLQFGRYNSSEPVHSAPLEESIPSSHPADGIVSALSVSTLTSEERLEANTTLPPASVLLEGTTTPPQPCQFCDPRNVCPALRTFLCQTVSNASGGTVSRPASLALPFCTVPEPAGTEVWPAWPGE
eukprot:RCo009378